MTTFANKNEVMENFEEQLRKDLHPPLLPQKPETKYRKSIK